MYATGSARQQPVCARSFSQTPLGQSQDFDGDLGWNTYQMRFRTHDPQIGRFIQIDPLASEYSHNSTYAYAENDVIRSIDVEGLEKFIVINNLTNGNLTSTTIYRVANSSGELQNQKAVRIMSQNGNGDYSNSNKLVVNYELSNGTVVGTPKASQDGLDDREKRIAQRKNLLEGQPTYDIKDESGAKLEIQPMYNDEEGASTIVTSHEKYDRASVLTSNNGSFSLTANSFSNINEAKDILNGNLSLNNITVIFGSQEQQKLSFGDLQKQLKQIFGASAVINSAVNADIINTARTVHQITTGETIQVQFNSKPE